MTAEQLTAILAERVMGWRVAPDRFMTAGRGWLPRWRFQPFAKLDDAFRLLDTAGAKYVLEADSNGRFTARVSIGDRTGAASGPSKSATITKAVAEAIGVSVPDELAKGARR
jgi:hypothetical protein